ncbi:MAG: tRNA lysidine(34) synthetase TilS [Gaiellales bacterium]
MARVLERVTATARRFEMFVPGDSVIVACSGGPDSICLLHALHRLRRLLRVRLAVFHFDHKLRKGSADDARYVAGQAERLRIPFVLREAVDAPRSGQSVEAWARLARYAALTAAASEVEAQRAAVGHTLDDQAETVLLGLVRGGGLEAVGGMPPVATLPPLGFPASRPLIETSRAEVQAFCRSLRLRPRIDPTNRDTRFLRNRIRHQVLPLLEKLLDRDLRGTLARTAENARGDVDYMEGLASEAAARLVEVRDEELRLDAPGLDALPPPIAARVVRQAIRLASAVWGEWGADSGAAHIGAVLELAGGRPGRRVDLPGDLMAERKRGYVRLSRSSPRRRKKGER